MRLLAWSVVAASAPAQDTSRVCTSDPRIRHAMNDGILRAALFRDLAAQLDASDVLVSAETDCLMPQHHEGTSHFCPRSADSAT